MLQFSNCKVEIKEGKLYTVTDLTKPCGLSGSGKSISYGTTHGIKEVVWKDVVLKLNVNVNSKNPKYVQTPEDKAKYKEIYSK